MLIHALKLLAVLGLCASAAWFGSHPDWEPGATWLGSLSVYLGLEYAGTRTSKGRFERLTTMRGISLLEAVTTVGLVDIEARDSKDHKLPPEDFFALASRELLLSGTTLAGTVTQHADQIETLLKRDCHVLLLLLDPDAKALTDIGALVGRDLLS